MQQNIRLRCDVVDFFIFFLNIRLEIFYYIFIFGCIVGSDIEYTKKLESSRTEALEMEMERKDLRSGFSQGEGLRDSLPLSLQIHQCGPTSTL